MSLCTDNPQHKQSKKIDKKIKKWMKEYQKAIQILLLGAGESGKTTIIKQMKLLHYSEFSDEEKKEKASHIKLNILESIITLAKQMQVLQIPLSSDINKEYLDYILSINPDEPFNFPMEFFMAASKLWLDPGIQKVYEMQHKYQLIDCAKYFLDKIDAVSSPNYTPSVDDILNSRHRTTDVQKIEFEVKLPKRYGKKSQSFWMFDVGGQRGERNKWIQVFDGVQAVLFLVSASCFDLVIREDEKTNRIVESVEIFEKVWHSRFLKQAGFILFLNKQDKLREKIKSGKKVGKYFREFENYELQAVDRVAGEDEEYLKARCFIRDMFIKISKQKPKIDERLSIVPSIKIQIESTPKECYSYFTVATDTKNIEHIFDAVHTMILMWNIDTLGMQ